ncbi:sigma-70 family RNA polymerase sigma factor [Actinocorallia aurantiaca]|uniref:RNA polymerase sigma-70 factor (ECF subfamily) n=1 Tax=Actinocorallia aurantiaca TaxID=46204 RepID=A0ABN3UJG1_9ACTN
MAEQFDFAPDVIDAFEVFVHQYAEELTGFALRLVPTEADAHDIVQQALPKLLVQWSGLQQEPVAMAKTIIRNLARDLLRKRRRGAEVLGIELQDRPANVPGKDERVQKVYAVLHQLPERQRATVALTLDGYGSGEVAEMLGSTPATVRSNLRHAIGRLKEALGIPQETTDGKEVADG